MAIFKAIIKATFNQFHSRLAIALVISLANLILSGCSFKTVREENHNPPPEPAAAASFNDAYHARNLASNLASNLNEKTAMQLRMNTNMVQKPATPEDKASSLAAGKPGTVTIDEGHTEKAEVLRSSDSYLPRHTTEAATSLGWLKNGNTRYLKNRLRKDGISQKDRMRTLASESPHAIVFTDSDSRTPAEVIFDQKIGEIYVVRTAGQALDTAVVASIEHAVAKLGVKLLVVMGSDSVTVKSAMNHLQNPSDHGSPAMNELVASILPRFEEQEPGREPASASANGAVWANVHGVAKDLIRKSDIIKKSIASGHLKIAPSMYHLDTGVVEFK